MPFTPSTDSAFRITVPAAQPDRLLHGLICLILLFASIGINVSILLIIGGILLLLSLILLGQ